MPSTNLILSINAGSSSVKVSIYTAQPSSEPKSIAEISIAGLTAPPAKLTYTRNGTSQAKNEEVKDVKSAEQAYEHILQTLIADSELKELNSADDITFACHRVVHGGPYTEPTTITPSTLHKLEELSDLAPLHNGPALKIVHAVHQACPKTTNVAFFDSAFHATIPKPARTYAIDQEKAERNGLRKYGFHGLSYAWITRQLADFLGRKPAETNLIALHLGSGASACAIRGGESRDTTMGLTPLAGLPGATRSGDIDPSLVFHLVADAGKLSSSSTKELHITKAEEVLNKEAGWKAMTGTTDFGEILKKAGEGDERCKLAVDVLVERIVGYVGTYFVKLGGEVDGLVFAGGIGEKSAELRRLVVEGVGCLGFEVDGGKNGEVGEGVVVDVGVKGAKHGVFVCQTDEQTEMARQCALMADKLVGEKDE